jgi:F-type H+-transporting ATPase subunit epsilon
VSAVSAPKVTIMRLSVTTPYGSLVDADAVEVTAPGALGEFGVLPGHIPFLSAIRPGVLAFRTKEAVRHFAVGEGVLEVARSPEGDKVLVLVNQAATAEEIDRDTAAKELIEAEKQLAEWKQELTGEYHALRTRRDWAAARVDAAARASAH